MSAPIHRGKHLLIGEQGSGKTTRILARLRKLAADGRQDVRLVVPTATMAEHLRNSLAREGHLVRTKMVCTFAEFLAELSPNTKPVSQTALAFLMREVMEESPPAYFLPIRNNPGLAACLCASIDDLANAGCDSLQWAALAQLRVHTGPLNAALGEVYDALERKLEARGLEMRPRILSRLARELGERTNFPFTEILFDGFFQFGRGELELLRSLSRWSRLTVTLPEWSGADNARQQFLQMGFSLERSSSVRPAPVSRSFSAGNPAREAAEIGLRMLELHAGGTAWSDMGVVVRNTQRYGRLLETTFARMGIPVRSLLAARLGSHAVFRLLDDLVAAILSGWEYQATARVLLSAVSRSGAHPRAGEFDHIIRAAQPGQGLTQLQETCAAHAPPDVLEAAFAGLAPLSAYLDGACLPTVWADRLGKSLAAHVSSGDGSIDTRQDVRNWQSRAMALRGVTTALQDIAALIPAAEIPLVEFWRLARLPITESVLRTRALGRDTVHLMDIQEARQWELQVVFLCGLLEGEFPHRVTVDPILSDDVRFKLRGAHVNVSSRADQEAEEDFLLQTALSRARRELYLSWPENDMDGRPTLRAFAIDEWAKHSAKARPVLIQPAGPMPALRRPQLSNPDSLTILRKRHSRLRTTSLENFLQCPFQFFGRHTLKLQPPPPPPERRLDLPTQGTLIHQVLADWQQRDIPVEGCLESRWQQLLTRKRIPDNHRTEVARLTILRGLRFFAAKSQPDPNNRIEVERPVRLEIDGTPVEGRLDRIDISPNNEAVVYDFKFSGSTRLKQRLKEVEAGLAIQGGIYLAAVRSEGIHAKAFVYVGLRGDTVFARFDDPAKVDEMVERAVAIAGQSIVRIHAGEISATPADLGPCRYCELRQSCRLRAAEQVSIASA